MNNIPYNHAPSGYRSDIEGLRAIAVIFVVMYHAFPLIFRGGFIGVDIFFVISGYLISGIIISAIHDGNFRFSEFYARRIRRIFPALLVVMATTILVGRFILLPDDFAGLLRHVTGGALFYSNYLLKKESGYFDTEITDKPLMHLWSLSIEEQFYIIWPLFVFIALRRRHFIAITLFLLLLSFIASQIWVYRSPALAFYFPFTRFWELLIGGVLAYIQSDNSFAFTHPTIRSWYDKYKGAIHQVMSVLGGWLIFLGLFLINKNSVFPGWWVLLPVLGAWLVIAAGSSGTFNVRILSMPAMRWIGKISYPLYLWHWPVFSLSTMASCGDLSGSVTIALVLLSVIAAWLTYVFVERYTRYGKFLGVKAIILLSLMIGLAGVGATQWPPYKNTHIYPEKIYEMINVDVDNSATKIKTVWRDHQCFLEPNEDNSLFTSSCAESDRRPLVFLWGDSHAAALYPGLKKLQEAHKFGIAQYTASNCPPFANYDQLNRPYCRSINTENLKRIQNLHPDIVILHANWLLEKRYDLIGNVVNIIRSYGIKRIVLIGPVAQWKTSLPKLLVQSYRDNKTNNGFSGRMQYGLAKNLYESDEALRLVARQSGIEYISAINILCRL